MWGKLPQPIALAQRSHLAGYIALGYHGVALDKEPLDNAKLGFTGNHRWSILALAANTLREWLGFTGNHRWSILGGKASIYDGGLGFTGNHRWSILWEGASSGATWLGFTGNHRWSILIIIKYP